MQWKLHVRITRAGRGNRPAEKLTGRPGPTPTSTSICQWSRGTYGAPRVHAELRLGYGTRVGHNAEGDAYE